MNTKKVNKRFLKNYCNFEKLNNLIITFDIDWAPEFMIEEILEITKNLNITIFNTHPSKLLKNLKSNRVCVGIHPNIQKGSSQGKDLNIIKNYLKNVGDFKYLRFHLLGHSSRDLEFFTQKGTKIDSSYYLPNQPFLIPTFWSSFDLVRVPYTWEDGFTLSSKKKIEKSINLKDPGLKVLNFHPIDIYLNTYSIDQRNKFKNNFKSVLHSDKKSCEQFMNHKKFGVRDFLINTINIIKNKKIKTTNFNELNYQFRRNLKII